MTPPDVGSPWWRGAVFYEVYVRSFADSNDDGIGDLPGVTSRLPYLKELGIDGLWLAPFYPSPQADHGYDVADYYNVNPEYGTLDDFDDLLRTAHGLGLKVIVDLVPNHTSSRHPWFEAALSAPDDPHRELYYFVEGKGGDPPNNWTSAFSGPAWSREERWGHWYMHLFAPEQPDLNWWNPNVPEEFEQIVRFWLDRGADGFRIDVAIALYKRKDLADRPLVPDRITGEMKPDPAFSITDQDEVHDVYRAWRGITDSYAPNRVLVGEIFDPLRQRRYIRRDQLHMAFAYIDKRWDPIVWRRAIDVFRRAVTDAALAPSWTLSNHDVVRHVTRLGGGPTGRARARVAMLLLLGMPGQHFMYQGDELGLEEAYVPPDDRQDPIFIHSGGKLPGRDGCRVPLPWMEGAPNAGFSKAQPWLPMPGGWDRLAVDAQSRSADSMLSLYRRVLSVRKAVSHRLPAVMRWERSPAGCLRYSRGALTVICNFTSRVQQMPVRGRILIAGSPGVRLDAGCLTLPGDSAAWIETRRAAHS